jgi:putative transposase
MRAAQIMGVHRRKWTTTTDRDTRRRPAPDLVERDFTAPGPDQLWVADITYVPTWAGFLYLAVIIDVWSRKVVGWATRTDLATPLVLDALDMAISQRQHNGVIHHSDQGSQYTSVAFSMRCQDAGITPSMGSVGDAYDNALCESFFATLETELIARHSFQTRTQARTAVFDFIEGFYNTTRRHSAVGNVSPNHYEKNQPTTN